MLVFSTVAILLVVATLLFLLPPLLQGKDTKNVIERKDLNVLLYKDQLAELEADLKTGAITQEQFEQAQSDLERSLLKDVEEESGAKSVSTNSGKYAAIVVGITIPLVAIGMYAKMGEG